MRYRPDHRARTRDRVLQTARRLFADRGYGKVSIEDVMRDCGLTRGGFYAHFRSKAALYREAMGHSVEEQPPQPYAPLPFWAPTPD